MAIVSPIKQYVAELNKQYQTHIAREHSYRPALKDLLQSLLPQMVVTNEPAHFECGAPDYIIQREKDHLPVFFVEAKDIGDNDLDGRKEKGHQEQFNRYKQALDRIIFTDYLDFHLYEYGEFVDSVRIAELKGNKIESIANSEEKFIGIIRHLGNSALQSITSAARLAELMAGKARLLANIIKTAMNDETSSYDNDNLQGQYKAFKDVLIKELTKEDFADIYAQTICYGMFAARLHDDTPEDFSREEAARLIPKTNPFLRQIFNNLAGNDLDERIAWVVDDLVTVFQATNLRKLMANYTTDRRHHDPMIHFYEDFLAKYDSNLRESKGVWYTPQPVVSFIVRAVDEILQKEFDLPEGLADFSMVEKTISAEQVSDRRTTDGMKHLKRKFHRVQILDPATGTGTFLAEVVNQIYDYYRDNQGIWQEYVEKHLIPRLHGFEILMASYAVAHIKLDMLLSETGYQHKTNQRLHVYLTNSLEESNNEPRTLFAQWLSREATEADIIKRDCPVMVMIGNPPYSGISQNNGSWIMKLIGDYKKEPGGIDKLIERKHWLNDDYVKFIRLAQDYIDRNDKGIIGFINNNGFLDNPTFRGMRWHLLSSFDKIYIINLHGSSKKKETTLNSGKDENVFDITLGTSINIFIKTSDRKKGKLSEVYYTDLYGSRKDKYDFLSKHSLANITFKKIAYYAPFYSFVPSINKNKEEYDNGFLINDLCKINSNGVVTSNDTLNISFSSNEQKAKINDILNMEEKEWRIKYKRSKDAESWKYLTAKNDAHNSRGAICTITYRPFDTRYTFYTGNSNGLYARPLYKVMQHMLQPNIALVIGRQGQAVGNMLWNLVFCANTITDFNLYYRGGAVAFPLYIYPEEGSFETERKVNLDETIWNRINTTIDRKTAPEDVFDYIYGVLHSYCYRERYKEFLKVDFPRIPYPQNGNEFEHYRTFGSQLRQLHLMQNLPKNTGISFPQTGTLQVDSDYYWEQNRVYINKEQYFDNVPKSTWSFYIGGYQPAQKWLKDRRGMTLTFEDVKHYQRIIYVLKETETIMEQIDKTLKF